MEKNPASNSLFKHTFDAVGKGINSYKVNLITEIKDICSADSTLTINVNPIPKSEFNIDTLDIGCDYMVIEIDALQKGLVDYNWIITKGSYIFMIDTLEDNFTYRIQRPGPTSENLNVKIDLKTANYAFCESDLTAHSYCRAIRTAIDGFICSKS